MLIRDIDYEDSINTNGDQLTPLRFADTMILITENSIQLLIMLSWIIEDRTILKIKRIKN